MPEVKVYRKPKTERIYGRVHVLRISSESWKTRLKNRLFLF